METLMKTMELLNQTKEYANGKYDAFREIREHYRTDDSKTFFKWLSNQLKYHEMLVNACDKATEQANKG